MTMGQSTLGAAKSGAVSFKVKAFMTGLLGVFAFAVLAATPSRADSDNGWYSSVLNKSAASSGTRIAALGGPISSSSESRAQRRKSSVTGVEDRPQTSRKSSGTRTASLGRTRTDDTPARRPSVTGGGVSWVASAGCLNGTLRGVIYNVASSYGAVTVSSTCRSAGHNARVGGAPKSMHLSGDAADFRVHGNWGGAYASLRSNGSVGGLKHYGGGLFHIDTGARRSW